MQQVLNKAIAREICFALAKQFDGCAVTFWQQPAPVRCQHGSHIAEFSLKSPWLATLAENHYALRLGQCPDCGHVFFCAQDPD